MLRRIRASVASRWLAPSAAAIVLATFSALVFAFGLKAPCLTDYPVHHQPMGCYNDIQTLWDSRGLGDHLFPYQGTVTREPGATDNLMDAVLGPSEIEYPVVTGLFAWVTSLPVTTRAAFLVVSALALAPLALLTGWLLSGLAGRRALLFALSPQLVAFAFLNWDLLPVAAAVAAVWAWSRDRLVLAGLLLGVGASAKIWPGFLLVPLLLALLLQRRYRDAWHALAGAVAATIVINGPFIIHNTTGWLAPFIAQSLRHNDVTTNSVWYLLFQDSSISTLNLVSGVAVLAAWTALVLYGVRRWRREGLYPWLQVGAAMVTAYIVLGRVASPQYGLWVVPFLVLIRVPTRWVAAFTVANILLWLRWSWLFSQLHGVRHWTQWLSVLVLMALTVVIVRSPAVPLPSARPDTSRGLARARGGAATRAASSGGSEAPASP